MLDNLNSIIGIWTLIGVLHLFLYWRSTPSRAITGKGKESSNECDTLGDGEDLGSIFRSQSQTLAGPSMVLKVEPGSANTKHPEVPVEVGDDIAQERLRVLLEELLLGFRLTGIFSHPKAPSFFLIYAHNNPKQGQADDRTVKQFIHDFHSINAKIRSDRSKDLPAIAKADIFHNQACLLPRRVASRAVDLVVLFHSEALSAYCREKHGRDYISRVKRTSKPILDALYKEVDRSSSEPKLAFDYQAKVKSLINNQRELHHVLTELAFVEMRATYDRNIASIIPVSLHGGQAQILEDLPYLRNTSHYYSMKHFLGQGLQEQQRCFLGLVERIYGKAPVVIDFMKTRYDEGIKNIKRDPKMSIEKFRIELRYQLTEDLRRFTVNGPFEVSHIESHDYGELLEIVESQSPDNVDKQLGDSENTQPLQATDRDETFRGLIPHWLLVDPDETQQDLLQHLHSPLNRDRILPIASAVPGTLSWLEQNKSYQEWIENECGMLGIRGLPGSGKSTATKHIFRKLQKDEQATHLHLHHFFTRTGNIENRNRQGFYKSLLSQLLSLMPSTGLEYWQMAKRIDHERRPLELDELQGLLLSALSKACDVCRVRLFVDALDEVEQTEVREVVADLRKFNTVINRQRRSLSICYACRYFPAIVVDNGLQIKVDRNNREGISYFVEQELKAVIIQFRRSRVDQPCLFERPWSSKSRETYREKLQRLIVENSNGMFLVAKLTMDQLRDTVRSGSPFKRIVSRVENMQNLEFTFEDMLDRSLNVDTGDQSPRKILMAIVRYMDASSSPPTLAEIQAMLVSEQSTLGIDVPERSDLAQDIERYSAGLLKVVEPQDNGSHSSPVVVFTHLTVRNYFHDLLAQESGKMSVSPV